MGWSPSDDPWGAGMLASGILWGAAFFGVAARVVSRRTSDTAAGLMTLGATGFLVCATLGAMQRPGPRDAPGTALAGPEPGETPEPASVGDDEGPQVPPTLDPVAPPDAGVTTPAPLPTDPAERRAAIRDVLRDARLVYEDEEDCKDAAAVGRVWKAMDALPDEARTARAKAVVRRLETCRRQVRWATMFVVHRDRIAAREAFAETLRDRIADAHGIDTQVKTFGNEQDRLRVGSGALDDAMAAAVLTDALVAEAAALGFESVTLARPGKTWREAVEPRPDSEVVDEALAPFGLDRPLKLNPR